MKMALNLPEGFNIKRAHISTNRLIRLEHKEILARNVMVLAMAKDDIATARIARKWRRALGTMKD